MNIKITDLLCALDNEGGGNVYSLEIFSDYSGSLNNGDTEVFEFSDKQELYEKLDELKVKLKKEQLNNWEL